MRGSLANDSRYVTGTLAARGVRLLTAGLAVGASFALSSPAPAQDAADQWTAETGIDRAKSALAQCSAAAPDKPSGRATCVLAAFEACEDEHGTSQRALNDCAAFSRGAWEARLAAARSRLFAAKSADSLFGSPDKLIALLTDSERRWDAWNGPDCDIQAALSEGGSFHRYELYICLSNHAAYRAIELESLIQVWGKIFKL